MTINIWLNIGGCQKPKSGFLPGTNRRVMHGRWLWARRTWAVSQADMSYELGGHELWAGRTWAVSQADMSYELGGHELWARRTWAMSWADMSCELGGHELWARRTWAMSWADMSCEPGGHELWARRTWAVSQADMSCEPGGHELWARRTWAVSQADMSVSQELCRHQVPITKSRKNCNSSNHCAIWFIHFHRPFLVPLKRCVQCFYYTFCPCSYSSVTYWDMEVSSTTDY